MGEDEKNSVDTNQTALNDIGLKGNLSSVSDVDREIPTRGLTDNARKEVSQVSSIIR